MVRLDSLSKVVAAGLRVGFVAGPHEVIFRQTIVFSKLSNHF